MNKKEVVNETPAKKDYTAPKLVEYGSISKLTQGGGGTVADGSSLMHTPCL